MIPSSDLSVMLVFRDEIKSRPDLFVENKNRAVKLFEIIGTPYRLAIQWMGHRSGYRIYFTTSDSWVFRTLEDIWDELTPEHQLFFVFHLDTLHKGYLLF